MADHSKRTTVLLTVVAILFILTIIILCLPYDIGHQGSPSTDKINSDKTPIVATTTKDPTTTSIKKPTSSRPISATSTSETLVSTTTETVRTEILHSNKTSETDKTTVYNTGTTDGTDSSSISSQKTVYDTGITDVTDNSSISTKTTEYDNESTDGTATSSISSQTSVYYTDGTDNSSISTETTEYDNESTDGTDTSSLSSKTTVYSTDITDGTDNSSISTETTEYDNESTDGTGTSSISSKTTDDLSITTEANTYSTNSTDATTSVSLSFESSSISSQLDSTTSTIPFVVQTPDHRPDEPECNKTQCKNLAAKMWLIRDINANPCENFYQYACGGAVDNKYLHTVDASDAIKRKILDNIRDGVNYSIARDFYDSCLKQDLVNARNQWENTSNWMDIKVPTDETICDKDILTDTLAKLIKNNFGPLFDVSLGLHTNDTSGKVFKLRVTPPISRSPFSDDIMQLHCLKQYELKIMDEDIIDIEKEYETYVHCKTDGTGIKARLDNLESHLLQLNVTQDQNLFKHTLEFFNESSLLKNESFTSENLLQLDYKNYTIEKMNVEFGKEIDWTKLLSSLVNQSVDPATTHVEVHKPEYLKRIIDFLNEEMTQSKPVCKILQTLWKESRYIDFVAPQRIESALVPYSEEYCLDLTTSLLPEMLYSHNETKVNQEKRKVSEVRDNIVDKTTQILSIYGTITDENQKLQNFYLDQSKDHTFSPLGNNEDMSAKTYQEKSLLLLERLRSVYYTKLFDSQVDQDLNWLIHLTFEDAVFNPENKYLPASYMEAPYYMEDEPAYLNYAGFGAAMVRSALRTKQEYKTNDFYSVREIFQSSTNMTVSMKVHNDSMDSEALVSKIAWEGYQHAKNLVYNNLTTELNEADFAPLPWLQLSSTQLFYLRSAQMHCEETSRIDILAVKERGHIPGQIRVNEILMNETPFREAFCQQENLLTTTAS